MVTGSEWLSSLPENPGPNRDKMVLDAVTSGLAHCEWMPIDVQIDNHKATFYVSDDAFRVDLDDGSRFRFQVSATLAQKCADVVAASLPTSKICDFAYNQASVVLPATILPASPQMASTTYSKNFNNHLELKRNNKTGLIRDCGKAWILDNKLLTGQFDNKQAINHGFYSPDSPFKNKLGVPTYQVDGSAHDNEHEDYSQLLILMLSKCIVNGQESNVIDVMKDPVISLLLNYDGILKCTRQP